jgi:hypothetical protein
MRFGCSQFAGWKSHRRLPAPTATALVHRGRQDRLHPWHPVDTLLPLSSVLSRTLAVDSSYPELTRFYRAVAYGVSKLSTTPARDVDDAGGETAFTPMPRLAKPAHTSGRSSGFSADTAVIIASRAWVKVG